MIRYEHLRQPLATRAVFIRRMGRSLLIALGLIAVSLLAGMWGYHHYEGLYWIDAFANAAMILSGMGPLAIPMTTGGKLFAGSYALFSGLFLIFMAGLILAPAVHRLLHSLHIDDKDEGS
jgi:Co/Zn/Cd efflux system component